MTKPTPQHSIAETMPPPSPRGSHAETVYIPIPNDEHSTRAMEIVCFERKFNYRKVTTKPGNVLPPDGHVFYEVIHTDSRQLFWLGAAWQSQINQ